MNLIILGNVQGFAHEPLLELYFLDSSIEMHINS